MKWEYHLYSVGLEQLDHDIDKSLNELGQQGWELVTAYKLAFRVFVLKRPISSAS